MQFHCSHAHDHELCAINILFKQKRCSMNGSIKKNEKLFEFENQLREMGEKIGRSRGQMKYMNRKNKSSSSPNMVDILMCHLFQFLPPNIKQKQLYNAIFNFRLKSKAFIIAIKCTDQKQYHRSSATIHLRKPMRFQFNIRYVADYGREDKEKTSNSFTTKMIRIIIFKQCSHRLHNTHYLYLYVQFEQTHIQFP